MAKLLSLPALPTFRDPAGSIEVRPDGAYRSIRAPFDEEILAFLATPLASEMVAQGRLVASEVVSSPHAETLVLRHPRISFQSYPWEWSPGMWLVAAELTLTLCSDLIEQGWQLKDATPLNVLFQGAQPIFVDVLSIERRDPHQPIWLAYGQFVRTFLLPMLAYSRLGWPLRTSLTRRDGYEPEEVYPALSLASRFRQPALSTVTLPSLLAKTKKGRAGKGTPQSVRDPDLAKQILLRTMRTLLNHMRKVTPAHRFSNWSHYAETANHYSDEDHADKRKFVSDALGSARPAKALDVGCNTGVYSNLAADAGAEVVSIDTDLPAVDRLYAGLKENGKNILPLCVDLAHPSPATGWENRESASFLSRCAGHFDAVIMLAVLHHLLLHNQIPMDRIAALCGELTTRHLIVEWVPATDQKFQELLRGRDALYQHVTETAFREAFGKHFTVSDELTLANGRILFHLQKR
ncbi:class I SAM-dependent methyltransferase [Tunturibacter empetritectus]|uniref:SAM-dependent methyltransferase n=1 Tax=Tunturiibacter empetritectus TaxID=3069691 RepID=A0A7W8MS64_9BACT|nr:class I SAM-dependent methyltransferase [Edaphobacter lichenicola]MBB5317560.1 SAM-dependent methyltransferase [Edaphobacter lichenicola]